MREHSRLSELFKSVVHDRNKDDRFSPSILKNWMRFCEHQHGEQCAAPIRVVTRRYNRERQLILVDTQQQSLVLDMSSSQQRYIALSYLWGGVTALQTTNKNIQELQVAGVLSKENAKLPQTMRDTMVLVSSIGERYLWIDSLCIIQDDVKNKQYTSPKWM
jgi:hypothetical protein